MGRNGIIEGNQHLVIEDHQIFEGRRLDDPIEAQPTGLSRTGGDGTSRIAMFHEIFLLSEQSGELHHLTVSLTTADLSGSSQLSRSAAVSARRQTLRLRAATPTCPHSRECRGPRPRKTDQSLAGRLRSAATERSTAG